MKMFRLSPQLKLLRIGDDFDKIILQSASIYLTSLKTLIVSNSITSYVFDLYRFFGLVRFKTVNDFQLALVCEPNFDINIFFSNELVDIFVFDCLEKFRFIYNGIISNRQA